ncbi:hypothetical protein KY328_01765 [Candidatus Woesearchaeota archaeon]|nr:hypothetical protein [Candidatus Woesearchaeota archaeon]MBW3021624.1 hypothetical protein [Candidatus Woesearchaeota archaeon]
MVLSYTTAVNSMTKEVQEFLFNKDDKPEAVKAQELQIEKGYQNKKSLLIQMYFL